LQQLFQSFPNEPELKIRHFTEENVPDVWIQDFPEKQAAYAPISWEPVETLAYYASVSTGSLGHRTPLSG